MLMTVKNYCMKYILVQDFKFIPTNATVMGLLIPLILYYGINCCCPFSDQKACKL